MLSEPSESMKPGPLGRNTTVPSGQSAVHNFPSSVRVLYGTVAWTFVVLGVANRTAKVFNWWLALVWNRHGTSGRGVVWCLALRRLQFGCEANRSNRSSQWQQQ